MKKRLSILAIQAVVFILPVVVLAQEPTQLLNPLGEAASIETVVKNATTAALGLTGVLALVAFVYGGLTWMMSYGDSSKIKKGKEMMIWAVLGLFFVFSSYAIVSFVLQAIGA